jgi:hypothetical protein
MKISQEKVFSPVTITIESKTDAIAFFRIIEEALDKKVKVHMLCESTKMAKDLSQFYREFI